MRRIPSRVPVPSIVTGVSVDAEDSLVERLRRVEADVVQRAIDAADGDCRLAAQWLGIVLHSLYRKLNHWVYRGSARECVLSRDPSSCARCVVA